MLVKSQKGSLALVVLAWVFATQGIFARYLSTSFALFEQTYLRIGFAFVLGALLFSLYSHNIAWKKFTKVSKRDFAVLVFRAVTLYLGVVLFTEAILHTKYGNASFIAAIPLLPLLGLIFLKERIKKITFAYILLGLFGMLLISLNDLSTLEFGYGEIMAFLSMLAFDFSYLARRWQSEFLNNHESTLLVFAAGTIFLILCSALAGEPLPEVQQFSPLVVLTIFLAAAFNVANLYLINYGFQHTKVAVAGNILTLETVFALLYSIFIYGEIPLTRELLGGFIIVYSVYKTNKCESS